MLAQLLREMQPRLHVGTYAYCTVPTDSVPPQAIGSFRESEGLTVILSLQDANATGLTPRFLAAWITLHVHSPLEAVGLTAAVARTLADANIPCNVVAACHHDHLFVPVDQAQVALEILERLSAQYR